MPRKSRIGVVGHGTPARKGLGRYAPTPSPLPDEGQYPYAREGQCPVAPSGNSDSIAEGQTRSACEGHNASAPAMLPDSAAEGQVSGARKGQAHAAPAALTDTIDAIRSFHRQRCFAMEQRKRADLALGAFLRTQLGWTRDKPEAERKRIAEQAKAIMAGKAESEWAGVVAAAALSREPFETIEKAALKQMEQLAETLPAWKTFGEPIRGFGLGGLSVIVAEAGDLVSYANHSKLWKRMGLAVLDGVRQGGLSKNARKEDWIEHGYNRQRRSRMWNIGDALIKGNRDGRYRSTYLARKQYELDRDPEMRPIQAHRRAQRYMEKKLLRDLWRTWRGAIAALAERPMAEVPPADLQQAA